MGTDSATSLKPIDAAKVRAIASRLASNHDGEVVAAARALVRIAAASGKRVEDLIAVPASDVNHMDSWFGPGRGWPKTGPAMSPERAAAADAFMRAAWFTDWSGRSEETRQAAEAFSEALRTWPRSKKPNWKFIVDGLCLVGKSGLLGFRDASLVAAIKKSIDGNHLWAPPPVIDAHILELARRHGIVAE